MLKTGEQVSTCVAMLNISTAVMILTMILVFMLVILIHQYNQSHILWIPQYLNFECDVAWVIFSRIL